MTRVIRSHSSSIAMIADSGKINSKNMGFVDTLNLYQL